MLKKVFLFVMIQTRSLKSKTFLLLMALKLIKEFSSINFARAEEKISLTQSFFLLFFVTSLIFLSPGEEKFT